MCGIRKGEKKIKLTGFYPGALSEEEWREGWRKLIYTNEYDVPYIGNFAIVACAHSLKKDILIFNTPWQTDDANANSPISVVSSTQFDPSNERKTEIPIVLLYDGVHFESSIPVSEEDVQKRATDEAKFRRKRAEEKQNERDQKRVTDVANLKAKRAQEKQNERDQKRATDEVNLKVKGAEEKQNERDQKKSTDEANLKAKRAQEKQNERDQKS